MINLSFELNFLGEICSTEDSANSDVDISDENHEDEMHCDSTEEEVVRFSYLSFHKPRNFCDLYYIL